MRDEGGVSHYASGQTHLHVMASLVHYTNQIIFDDDVLTNRVVRYMRYLSNKIDGSNANKTVLMDETAVFFEDTQNATVGVTGVRHVVIKSAEFASMRVIVVLAVTVYGRKPTPLVICKQKSGDRSISVVNSVLVAYQPQAWVDSDLPVN